MFSLTQVNNSVKNNKQKIWINFQGQVQHQKNFTHFKSTSNSKIEAVMTANRAGGLAGT